MKSIDEMTIYSNESYDLEVQRKNSNDFIESTESGVSFASLMNNNNENQKNENDQIYIDPLLEPRFARTICNFEAVKNF
jgi:hypothetical protein